MKGIVELVVGGVPLTNEAAGVSTAWMIIVVSTKAEVIGVTNLPHMLVASHVGCKATNVRGHLQALDGLHKVFHVVLPTQPATMTSIQVYGSIGVSTCQCLHGIADTFLICTLGSRIATSWVTLIGGQVGQGVRFDHKHHWNTARVFAENLRNLVDVFLFVLFQPCTAELVRNISVVTSAIRLVAAANLSIGCFCMAIAVRQVVDNEEDQLWNGLVGCIFQDAFHGVGAATFDLHLVVQPIC